MAYLTPASKRQHHLNPMAITADQIEKMPSPRIIRPHLPFYLLHPKLLDTSKVASIICNQSITCSLHNFISFQVVFVARNPKDVIVSYYFHHKLIKGQGFEGDIESFAQYFMDNEGL
jgi:hypothetical protein